MFGVLLLHISQVICIHSLVDTAGGAAAYNPWAVGSLLLAAYSAAEVAGSNTAVEGSNEVGLAVAVANVRGSWAARCNPSDVYAFQRSAESRAKRERPCSGQQQQGEEM